MAKEKTKEEEIKVEITETVEETTETQEVNFEEKYNETQDKFMRLYSEFENFKRRTAKEQLMFQVTANEKAVKEMLSVVDNFKRAEPLTDGIEIVRKDLMNSLAKLGVSKIECLDEVFNADLHEALTQVPNEEKKGLIIDVIEDGYKMGDKVIRFPKVVIGS